MKKRSTTPVSISFKLRGSLLAIAILMAAAAPMAYFATPTAARDYNAEIQAVQNQIDQYNAEASRLSEKADTLQNRVAQLENQKASIQAKIDLSQAEHDRLVAEIEKNEKLIVDNKDALGTVMADMYIASDISPLEMFASSTDISEFVDKQNKRSSASTELSKIIKKINDLKKQLEQDRDSVKKVLDDQTNQRNQLAATQAEQQRILNETRGEEAAYKQLSAEGQAKKRQLEQEQQAAIAAALRAAGVGGGAVAGDPSRGGYPNYLANSNYYSPIVDPWGMYARQCVSYTAWKVHQKNGYMPYWGGVGNANQWPGNARAAGIPVSTVPRAGSVGVIMAGQYGHVVWVESVNGDGTINISQYNEYLPGAGWGHYSERYGVHPSAYDYYIYF